jgi:DNA-binding winged helix-turn-helix (wHTH) protein/Tol biopolymer transport system component
VAEAKTQPRPLRFGNFELDLRAGELRRAGVKLKLSGQPFKILTILLEHAGEVVTREELREQLWPDTFVDFDHNLNKAINKIREVLRDSAESPRFVETLPRRGYRFIAPVESGEPASKKLAEEGPPKPPPKASLKPLHYGLMVFGVALITVAGMTLWKRVFSDKATLRVIRFTKLTDDGQAKSGPMATDGSRIYFNEQNLVTQVSAEGGEVVALPLPLKAPALLDMSREGHEFLVENDYDFFDTSFWVQPVTGGSPRRVGTVLGSSAGFGADETTILLGMEREVDSVQRDGSSFRRLFATSGIPSYFRFSPDLSTFRFTNFDYSSNARTIMEASANGAGPHKVLDGCCGEWTANGKFFVYQDKRNGRNDLFVLPEERGLWAKRLGKKPFQLTNGPLDFQYPLPSKDGKRIFAIGTSRRSELVRYDARSLAFIPYLPGVSADSVAFSPDGQWVTYTSYSDGTLWRSKIDGTDRLQLTFPPLQVFLPRWSPDGRQIAFNARLPDKVWNIYIVSSEGDTPQRVLPSEETQTDANWSPDGNSLAFGSVGVPHKPIYIIDLASKRVSVLPGSFGFYSPHWSPDGRHMAAIRTEKPQTLYLFDFATQKWSQAFGGEIGYENWSHDGRYIYFESYLAKLARFRIMRFRLSNGKTEELTNLDKIVRLTDSEYANYWFGIAPDDSPLIFCSISAQEIYALELE